MRVRNNQSFHVWNNWWPESGQGGLAQTHDCPQCLQPNSSSRLAALCKLHASLTCCYEHILQRWDWLFHNGFTTPLPLPLPSMCVADNNVSVWTCWSCFILSSRQCSKQRSFPSSTELLLQRRAEWGKGATKLSQLPYWCPEKPHPKYF